MLPAEPAVRRDDLPAGDLVTEYTSGSFREFLMQDAAEPALSSLAADPPAADGADGPAANALAAGGSAVDRLRGEPLHAGATADWLATGPRSADQPAGHRNGTRDRDEAPTLTDVQADDIDALPGSAGRGRRRKRRSRVPAVVLGVAVLLAAGLTGGFTLLHHNAGHHAQASASPSHGVSATASASAGPSGSRAPAAVAAKWSAPTPLYQQAAEIGNPTITGVSCPLRAACFAVDSVGAIMFSTDLGTWKTVATDTQAGLVAISCASATFCVALDSGGNAVTFNQGSWSSPAYIDSRVGTLTAASCPASTFCMAVDSGGSAFAYTGSATWQPFTVDPAGMGLASVSCTSATNCVAVGDVGDVFTYNGTSWSAGQGVDGSNAFAAVSCSSQAFCAAVDRSGKAAVFSGGQWAVAPVGTVADAIACPSDGYCVAVDSSGGALVYRNSHWSPVTSIDGGNAVQALSCPAVAACAATDSMGNVMYYSSTPVTG